MRPDQQAKRDKHMTRGRKALRKLYEAGTVRALTPPEIHALIVYAHGRRALDDALRRETALIAEANYDAVARRSAQPVTLPRQAIRP